MIIHRANDNYSVPWVLKASNCVVVPSTKIGRGAHNLIVVDIEYPSTDIYTFRYWGKGIVSNCYSFGMDKLGVVVPLEDGIIDNPVWLDQLFEQEFADITPSTKPGLRQILSQFSEYQAYYMEQCNLEEAQMIKGMGIWSPPKK